jgi:hypothetical protein
MPTPRPTQHRMTASLETEAGGHPVLSGVAVEMVSR